MVKENKINKCKLCGSEPDHIFDNRFTCSNLICVASGFRLSAPTWNKLMDETPVKQDGMIQIIEGIKREDGWVVSLVGHGEVYRLPKFSFECDAEKAAEKISYITGGIPIVSYEEIVVMREKK